jgi:hypothetical protein
MGMAVASSVFLKCLDNVLLLWPYMVAPFSPEVL